MEKYTDLSIDETYFEQELKEDSDRIVEIFSKYFNQVFYYDNLVDFLENIQDHKNDIVFPNWFGKNSRNRRGLLPAICEAYGIKYIGADTHTNILCSDKYLSKLYARKFGLNTSENLLFRNKKSVNLKKLKIIDLPIVVKPNFEGNSIGISNNSLYHTYEEALNQINTLLDILNENVLVEEYLEGNEVKVFLFGNDEKIHFMTQIKLIVDGLDYYKTELFGFETKMESKEFINQKVELLCHEDIIAMKKIFNSFSKVEYIRIDGRIKDGLFYLLELSPDCALCDNSSFSFAFNDNGMSYEEGIIALVLNSIFPEEFQIPNVIRSQDQIN